MGTFHWIIFFSNIFGISGYYTAQCCNRLDKIRYENRSKEESRRKPKTSKATATTTASAGGSSDSDMLYVINEEESSDHSNEDLNPYDLMESEADDPYDPDGDD